MAIALKRAGIEDFVLLEQADEVGGTWRDNRYPGAACDVESHLYSFSFEPNPLWSRIFASREEILKYLIGCANKFDVRRHIRFRTTAVRATFDEVDASWTLETRDGETLRARIVVAACGGLSRPAHPAIAGLGTFRGKAFHSAGWDPACSLAGKRVAIIGTGASAIQIVPSIAAEVSRLCIYQRTAPWIMPKPDRPIRPIEQRIFRRLPLAQRLARLAVYWQREALAFGFVVDPRIMKLGERVSRRHLERSIANPVLRATLTPNYRMGCKRVLPSNDYYPALLRENVEVVTEPIDQIRAHAVATTDGRERAADVIVFATGFQAADDVAPFDISGRGGHRLADLWRDGAEAYLGMTVSGFPNLFFIVGPNSGLGHSSMVFMIEAQVAYIRSCIETMRDRRLALVDLREDVQRSYNERLQARLGKTVWATGCDSWYRARSGKNTTLWPGFTFEFRLRARRFDERHYRLSHLSPKDDDAASGGLTANPRAAQTG